MSKLKSGLVWNRLRARLGIVDLGYDVESAVVDTIQPVTNVDELVSDPKIARVTKSLAGATGLYIVFHTVPVGKRWRLLMLHQAATVGLSEVAVDDGLMIMPISVPGAASKIIQFPERAFLPAGGTVRGKETNNAGDGAVLQWLWYVEESVN